jgi:putative DNA-invertase from lambdoid prophage Rac
MKAAIYARVSDSDQKYAMQLPDLRRYATGREWEVIEYLETGSSVKQRPVFKQMLADARARKVDVVLVWRIDRFARSMKDFVTIMLDLKNHGVRLISVTENVDSSDQTPMGQFLIQLLGLLAELERNIIIARVQSGMDEARRQGKHCGRPKTIFRRDEAVKMRDAGMSWAAIAEQLGVSKSAARRACEGVPKGLLQPN